jgi:hypothetical protein
LVLKDNLFDLRQWLRLGVRVVERRTHVKTKSLISWLAKGHRTHAFVWTEAGGLVEMPSLGRLENVGAASRTGAFTGFTIDKKSNGLHAGCGRRPPLHPRDRVSLHRRAGGQVMRTTLVTAGVLGLILMAGISARSDQASAQSRGHADFQGYWMGVDPVDGGDARRSLILRSDGTYALAARDTLLHLCDSTDRGFASFDDGTVVSRTMMRRTRSSSSASTTARRSSCTSGSSWSSAA